jgi:succinate dehydrogenase/fumarate reductase-like Fe-S protein
LFLPGAEQPDGVLGLFGADAGKRYPELQTKGNNEYPENMWRLNEGHGIVRCATIAESKAVCPEHWTLENK